MESPLTTGTPSAAASADPASPSSGAPVSARSEAVSQFWRRMGALPGPPLWLALALGALPFAIGGTLLIAAPAGPHRFGCQGPLANAPIAHAGRCDRGATVATSSALLQFGHHPLYLIDGRVGGLHEKWMSQLPDPLPWVEITLPKPTVARFIRIHHAGAIEEDRFSTRDFDVRVRGDGDPPGAFHTVERVRDNKTKITRHALPARPITQIRIEILAPGAGDEKAARLVEIEVLDH